jgi:hypothetical protein
LSSNLFTNTGLSKEIAQAVYDKISDIHRATMQEFVLPKNMHRFVHGGALVRPLDDAYYDGGKHRISTTLTLEFQALVENDLSVLANILQEVRESASRQCATSVFSVLGDASASVGNVVDAKKEGSILEAQKRMLEKIQIQVSPDGTPELPSVYMGSEAFEATKKAFAEAPLGFGQELDEIMQRKIEEGRERELARQSRFKQYGRKL